MKRVLWALTSLAFLGALVFALLQGFGKNPREVPFALLGHPAPAFSMLSLDGNNITLESLYGRPLVINFWSSWCRPCAEEAKILEAAYRQWGQKITFLGVVFEDSKANAHSFLKRFPASYPQLFSEVSTMAIDYAVTGVPETYFIDAQGKIVGKIAAAIPSLQHFNTLLKGFFPQLANAASASLPAPPHEGNSP